jgi:hypothetical protein
LPDVCDELVLANQTAIVLNEVPKDLIGLRTEVHVLVVACQAAATAIQREWSE